MEIDCPADCVYLQSGREYERSRRFEQGDIRQLTEGLWSRAFHGRNAEVLLGLWAAINQYRSQFPSLVDADVREVLEQLARTYRTLKSGLYYDHEPDTLTQKRLYGLMKSCLEEFQNPKDLSAPAPKTGDLLDCLQLNLELLERSAPSRPRSRDFLDWIAALLSNANEEPSRLEEPPSIILP